MNIKQTKRIEGMNTNEEEKKDGGEETKLKRIERQIESFNYYSLVRTSYLTEGQVVVNVRYVCVCVCLCAQLTHGIGEQTVGTPHQHAPLVLLIVAGWTV